jgi:hypothetical protein
MFDAYATVSPFPFGISTDVAAATPAQSTVPLEKTRVVDEGILFLKTQNAPVCSGVGYDSLRVGNTTVVVACDAML